MLNLKDCELEPVRFINSIQDFGALIVIDAEENIHAFSENAISFLQLEELKFGTPFKIRKHHKELFHINKEEQNGLKILQFEQKHKVEEHHVSPKMDVLFKSKSLKTLMNHSVQLIWDLIGFDRVLAYMFHEDLHGEVIAEKTKKGVESFLGLHFPSTDFPAPAREIFLESWLRVIPNVNSPGIPIRSKNEEPLDLGKILIRAASPIHIQYLKNMNIGSSLTLSIIVDGKLWGLFACHNKDPIDISQTKREQCCNITQVTSALVQSIIIESRQNKQLRVNKQLEVLAQNLRAQNDIAFELVNGKPNLLNLIDGGGLCVSLDQEGQWHTIGNVPSVEDLNLLSQWLSVNMPYQGFFHTESLSRHFPPFLHLKEIASGLLAVALPQTRASYILWFRPEFISEVSWAGNPEKAVEFNKDSLTPRTSFAEWKKTVLACSRSWELWELEAAKEIKNFILSVDIKRKFLSEQKAKKLAEDQKKLNEDVISMVSHDLRNPLYSIQICLELIEDSIDKNKNEVKELIKTAQNSIKTIDAIANNILSTSKMDSTAQDLTMIKQTIKGVIIQVIEMLTPHANKKGIKLKYQINTNIPVEYDFNKILQVLSNLVGNSLKFTPPRGEISITANEGPSQTLQVSVCDTGPGLSKEHIEHIFDRYWQAQQTKNLGTGLGLFIVKKIIDAHGGKIWVDSEPGKGSCFVVQLNQSAK